MLRWRHILREASLIILVAAGLGFSFTAFTHRGIFAEKKAPSAGIDTTIVPEFVLYDEAVQLYRSGSALFVDARHAYDYGLGHVRGAVSIPLQDFSSRELGGIPEDRTVVVYCDGQECNSSVELAKKIASRGYRHVKIFFGGWREWTQNKQPTEP